MDYYGFIQAAIRGFFGRERGGKIGGNGLLPDCIYPDSPPTLG